MVTKKIILFVSHLFAFAFCSVAQEVWSLEDCVEYALSHNVEIKIEEISRADSKVALGAAKWSHTPSIFASASGNVSFGRVLDVTTYQFIENQTVFGNAMSISANATLFAGLRKIYQQKKAELNVVSATLGLKQKRMEIRLAVTSGYIEVLCAKENIENISATLQNLNLQKEKILPQVKTGARTQSDIFLIEAKIADAQSDLIAAQNAYDIARLSLCQILEMKDYNSFVAKPLKMDAPKLLADSLGIVNTVNSLPQVQGMTVGIQQGQRDLQIARSAYYPTLSLDAGYGTNYSNSHVKTFLNGDGTLRYETYTFAEQYRNNANAYISIGLHIPIFNSFSTRKNVQRQKLAVTRAKYEYQIIKKQLYKTITEAFIDIRSAYARYEATLKYVTSAEEVARQMSVKYAYGVISVVDYNTAMTSEAEARLKHLQAKYEYLLKNEILKIYMTDEK